MPHVQLSIEEHLNTSSPNDLKIQQLLALDPFAMEVDASASPTDGCIPCDGIDFFNPQDCDIEKNELDIYLPKVGSSTNNTIALNDCSTIDNNIWTVFQNNTNTNVQLPLKSKHVLLSPSVGVTMPKKIEGITRPIAIVNALELNFKSRYKSDYFSQDGTIRPPRYVADQSDNHYVSIKVAMGVQGYLRIDWVTIPNEQNVRFSMPYKFQIDHKSLKEPDVNPHHLPVDADSSGLMKVYLVLIKSKLDELRNVESLQLFPPVPKTANKTPFKHMPPLSPKQLVQEYQLDKSQLAFTCCRLGSDGMTYIPDWRTTVFSTVMTERPTESSKKRKITCPQCLHSFHITMDAAEDISHEKVLKKRKK